MFKDQLKKYRELKHLTQGELAEKCGMLTSNISHFESGQREPGLKNLRKLIIALGISANVLLEILEYKEVKQCGDLAVMSGRFYNFDDTLWCETSSILWKLIKGVGFVRVNIETKEPLIKQNLL